MLVFSVMADVADPELEAAAQEELKHALALSWRELARLVPWGDAYDGFGPNGGAITFERGYLWKDEVGGDILCEVTAYRGPSRYDRGVRAAKVIRRTV
ncbi:MAG TPA: hypothetical protein VKU90_09750 [Caulobacteraceae bacterium]|nr:hypothetical protein [Caulobacteraceae bacterium]